MKKIGDDSILFAVSNGTVNGGSSVIDFLMYDVTENKLSTTRERLSGGTMDPKPITALIFDINEQTFLLKYGNTNVRMKGGSFSRRIILCARKRVSLKLSTSVEISRLNSL